MLKKIILLSVVTVVATALATTMPAQALSLINTTVESLNYNGQPSNSYNDISTVTPDGRYVAFMSRATDLIPGFTPPNIPGQNLAYEQVYLRDRQTNAVELISQSTAGDPAVGNMVWVPISVSNDGRFVLFTSNSDLTGSSDTTAGVYLRDRVADTTTRINPASVDDYAGRYAMSGDGNLILYTSINPFVNGELANDRVVTFLYNRATNTTTPLPTGAVNATITNDGHSIAYLGPAAEQAVGSTVAEFQYNVDTGATTQFTGTLHDNATGAVLSPDHTHAAYYADNADGSSYDLYDTNLATGQTRLISASVAAVGNPGVANLIESLSFDSSGTLLSYVVRGQTVDAYVTNLTDQQTVMAYGDLFYKILTLTLTADGSELVLTGHPPSDAVRQIYSAHFNTGLCTPANLTAVSPTTTPNLTWSTVNGADYYIVYRNGSQVGTSGSTSFTDVTAPEGVFSYTVAAANNAGAVSDPSGAISVLVDQTSPTVSNPTISNRVILPGIQSTISAAATDNLSGVTRGEYFVDADPGLTRGTPMSYTNGAISATLQTGGLSRGRHTVYMRAQDAAGNWSTTVSTTFVSI